MGKIPTKVTIFCLNKIRPQVRVRSENTQPKSQENSPINGDEEKKDGFIEAEKNVSVGGVEKSSEAGGGGRRVMVVVDSSSEAKNALQWALSHTVQNQDMLVLLHVTKPTKQGDQSDLNSKASEFLTSMKSYCQIKRPEVHVELAMVEGKDKGPVIVEAVRAQRAAMLVVGQKKRSVTWRLMMMWAGNHRTTTGGVAEYCVENSPCMAIAVRRKSKKLGGYLITTKRHKDFWLLA